MANRVAGIIIFLFCVLFIALAVPWIGKPGMQTDEVLFARGIYPPFDERFTVRIFDQEIPIMVMSYVGALKARVWEAVFAVWPPSPASVRVPAVLLGAMSIWWTYLLMARTLGRRAGLAGAALLSTDPVYILYSRWDHGPVVIQHLCLTGAMLALIRFDRERRMGWLVAGFFALGLGLWEKAVFAWLVSGLCIAGLILFRRRIRSALSLRNLAAAAAAFAVGASPLIVYNARSRLSTVDDSLAWSTDDLAGKARLLRGTLEGEAAFGSVMREEWDGPLKEPSTRGARATVWVARRAGLPRRTLMGYLAIASLLFVPFIWRTPAGEAARFVLICGGVAWFQMAFVQGTGGAAHHTILLWPLPTIGIATVLTAVSRRVKFGQVLLIATLTVACASNLLVLSTYYTNLLRNGGTASWTDAMYPALRAIHRMDKAAVCAVDWGFTDTLRLFERGRIPIDVVEDPVNEASRQSTLFLISQPGNVFLTHTEGNESFPGITARLVQFAEKNGFRRVQQQVFADTNGRDTVEIFRFASGVLSPRQ